MPLPALQRPATRTDRGYRVQCISLVASNADRHSARGAVDSAPVANSWPARAYRGAPSTEAVAMQSRIEFAAPRRANAREACSAIHVCVLAAMAAVAVAALPPKLPQLPPMRTCAPGSPACVLPPSVPPALLSCTYVSIDQDPLIGWNRHSLSFCDQALSHEQRAALLASELTEEEQITLWALHSYHYPIERLNIKGLHRDTCCVHGPALNFFDGSWTFPPSEKGTLQPRFVSVFPHAINHGAMFDLDLVARLANATGNEMRAASQIRYRTSGGQAFAAIICDSGPLANTAHHPAWGRISETYGEVRISPSRCCRSTRRVI